MFSLVASSFSKAACNFSLSSFTSFSRFLVYWSWYNLGSYLPVCPSLSAKTLFSLKVTINICLSVLPQAKGRTTILVWNVRRPCFVSIPSTLNLRPVLWALLLSELKATSRGLGKRSVKEEVKCFCSRNFLVSPNDLITILFSSRHNERQSISIVTSLNIASNIFSFEFFRLLSAKGKGRLYLTSKWSGMLKASKLMVRFKTRFWYIFHLGLTTFKFFMMGIGFSLGPKNKYPSFFKPKSNI